MSLFGSLNTAVTGFRAQAQKMGTISDNIANADTDGYKAHETRFQSLVSTTAGTSGRTGVSGGVRAVNRLDVMEQGRLQSTDRKGDLAIEGNGFLLTRKGEGADGPIGCVRTGIFRPDQEGYLRNKEGHFLQGQRIIDGAPQSAVIPQAELSAAKLDRSWGESATDAMTFSVVLPKNPQSRTKYTSSVDVYDSLGQVHPLTLQSQGTQRGRVALDVAIQYNYWNYYSTEGLETSLDRLIDVATSGTHRTLEEFLGTSDATKLKNIANDIDSFDSILAEFEKTRLPVSDPPPEICNFYMLLRYTGLDGFDLALKKAGIADSFDALLQSKGQGGITGFFQNEEVRDVIQEDVLLTGGDYFRAFIEEGEGDVHDLFLELDELTEWIPPLNEVDDYVKGTLHVAGGLEELLRTRGLTDAWDTHMRDYYLCNVIAEGSSFFFRALSGGGSTDWFFDDVWTVSVGGLEGALSSGFSTGNGVSSKITFNINNGEAPANWPANAALEATWADGAAKSHISITPTLHQGVSFQNVAITANGQTAVDLADWRISDKGVVEMVYQDGTIRGVYQLPVASCADPNRMTEKNGIFYANRDSGTLEILAASQTSAENLGTLTVGALESSNVDLAQELSEMIKAQNTYSANTRVLTTVNQMLQELMRI